MKTKTKKQIKRVHHTLTKKKLLKQKHAHKLLRAFFILIATVSSGSLAFAITTTKPTLHFQIQTTLMPHPISVNVVPSEALPDQIGSGSWYALGLPAPDSLTCASTRFPRGTYLLVKNLRNGRTVVCLVNDYGPEAWTHRVIDLSRGSFRQIDDLGAGTAPVEIRVVPPPPTSLNIDLPTNFASISGYGICLSAHTKEFCEQHRQDN